MAREIDRLTVAEAARLQLPGLHAEGRGLYLQIVETAAGTLSRSWIFRYRALASGRTRDMGLGSARDFNLLMARKRAEAARRLLADGKDPIEQREADRVAVKEAHAKAATVPTFETFALEWWEENRLGWEPSNAALWKSSMKQDAFPKIGRLPVNEVDRDKVLSVLRPMWKTKVRSGKRLQKRIEKVLGAATVAGHRVGPNPAAWRDNLDQILPSDQRVAPIRHFDAMPYAEVPILMAELRASHEIPARALEFTILTASRTGSVVKARWQEINLETATWIVPALHMKKRREHRVPLCARAAQLLRDLPREGEYVFIGNRRHKPMSKGWMPDALAALLKKLELSPCVVHGFRSSFRDWAGEETDFQNDICEVALAHQIAGGNATWLSYQRGDLLRKRRALMDAWGAYCREPHKALLPVPARVASGA
jgi:integrase